MRGVKGSNSIDRCGVRRAAPSYRKSAREKRGAPPSSGYDLSQGALVSHIRKWMVRGGQSGRQTAQSDSGFNSPIMTARSHEPQQLGLADRLYYPGQEIASWTNVQVICCLSLGTAHYG